MISKNGFSSMMVSVSSSMRVSDFTMMVVSFAQYPILTTSLATLSSFALSLRTCLTGLQEQNSKAKNKILLIILFKYFLCTCQTKAAKSKRCYRVNKSLTWLCLIKAIMVHCNNQNNYTNKATKSLHAQAVIVLCKKLFH
jgi:hypothetical protein